MKFSRDETLTALSDDGLQLLLPLLAAVCVHSFVFVDFNKDGKIDSHCRRSVGRSNRKKTNKRALGGKRDETGWVRAKSTHTGREAA